MPSTAEQIGTSDGEATRAHLNLHLTVVFTYGLYTAIFLSALRLAAHRYGIHPSSSDVTHWSLQFHVVNGLLSASL